MNQTGKPLVSVIITTYKNEALLPRAIGSVLSQTYPEIELIVVDDNAPDSPSRRATEAVMERFPSVRYLRHPENRNGAAARNTGIRAACGKYLAFLDNDDMYFSGHIARCTEALEAEPDCVGALCGVVKISSGLCWEAIPAVDGDIARKLMFSETALGTGSNLFARADAVREIGGFDESFLRHQDVEFGLRLFAGRRACSLNTVDIVKEMDGFSNVPDFDRFRDTKRQLWKKFDAEIQRLDSGDRKRYFAGQYSALLYAACKGGLRENILWTKKQLKSCRALSTKEQIILAMTSVGMFPAYEAFKLAVKRRSAAALYRRVTEGLEPRDRSLLDSALTGCAEGGNACAE